MKISLKVLNLNTSNDVQSLRTIISNCEGIVACEINKAKKEVNVVFDNRVITDIEIITSIENDGYSVV